MCHWVPRNWLGKHLASAHLCPPQTAYKLTWTRIAATKSRRVNHLIPGTAFRALLRHHSRNKHQRQYHFVLTFNVSVYRHAAVHVAHTLSLNAEGNKSCTTQDGGLHLKRRQAGYRCRFLTSFNEGRLKSILGPKDKSIWKPCLLIVTNWQCRDSTVNRYPAGMCISAQSVIEKYYLNRKR